MFRTGILSIIRSQHNLYDIYLLLCIQYWTPDDGQKNIKMPSGPKSFVFPFVI